MNFLRLETFESLRSRHDTFWQSLLCRSVTVEESYAKTVSTQRPERIYLLVSSSSLSRMPTIR